MESEREGERRIEVEMSFSSYSLTVSLSSSLSFPPLSLLFSLFPSSLSVVSPPPPAPQYSARWPLREDAHLRYQDAPVRGRGGEGVAAPGERGVETCFLSFSALFPPCRCLFSLFFSDLETFPPKKYKNKTKSSSTSSSSRPVSASTRCRKGKKRIS